MMTKFAAACSALCFLACDVADTGTLELALEGPEEFTFDVVAAPEAALIGVVPAANVADLVPDPYQVLVLPGAAADGSDGALLWQFAGFHSSVTLDGEFVGSQVLLHTAVQILEPPPPPGEVLAPGAAHLYEVRVLFSNKETPKWAKKGPGEPMLDGKDMQLTVVEPGEAAGVVEVVAQDEGGQLSFHAEHGALAPAPGPSANTWYQGKDGLSFSVTDFGDFQAAGASGAICADAGTWLGNILGADCIGAGGLAFTSNVAVVFKLFAD